MDAASITTRLRAAGCVAAAEEAAALVDAAGGDPERLAALVERRCNGEPLAWLVGSVRFCGETIVVHPGVYVPRWQTQPLAEEAARRLPPTGAAADLCTGAGAIAVVLARRRPLARVVATELDRTAADCARANGVAVIDGDLFDPLPLDLRGRLDVVTAVVPYVPTDALHLLPRDVLAHEPRLALDGGQDGLRLLRRVVAEAGPWMRSGGSLLLELGADQADQLAPDLRLKGFVEVERLVDEEGDLRGVCARVR